ncbi:MAG: AAA family ATPase, partial [Bacteroidia bacterium]|nr:AAA family ATPase [Bacteroidia bacterium]
MVKEKSLLISRVETEIQRVVVGQANMINRLLIGLFANGHILLEGVPGLAKTLTVASLAKALHLTFKRIQFTPDLLPADVVGTLIFNQKELRFDVRKGPIFANIVLADEINRSPAKVQSALLEAMQEKQVTIGEQTYLLEKPFLVLATQNPLEQEGTYPLPEAQMDRFMMKIYVNYPTKAEEKEIMRRMAKVDSSETVQPVLDAKEILAIRRLIDQIHLSERLEDYIVDIIMATREPGLYGLTPITKYLAYGVSPRATIALNLAAKTYALVKGRTHVLPEDIKEVAPDVLNHRLI